MKVFNVPANYRSPLIRRINERRRLDDKMKKDFSPTLLDFGPLQIFLARHFGFCYGVENAIDIAFRTIDENPGKNIFLLSEMIHNPQVNDDLKKLGVRFLQDTSGQALIPLDTLRADDIVITPAFGTSLEMDEAFRQRNIQTAQYSTTCPFVEKVWNRSGQLAAKNFTVIIHGKPGHEETRATFSRAAAGGPALIIKDMAEAMVLASFISGSRPAGEFDQYFKGRYSAGFDPAIHLRRIGVVNQTTMLASETQGIADFLKTQITNLETAPGDLSTDRFADTRDTLCYATNDNQSAVAGMLQTPADLAIVVGGYNSSNTSHLVELCELKLPTFFISDASKIIADDEILHYDLHAKTEMLTRGFAGNHQPVRILLTSGASCPDAVVEGVIYRLLESYPDARPVTALFPGPDEE